MKGNRLLVVSLVLIVLGLIGVFATGWLGRHQWTGGGPLMPGMMTDGMMNRGQMKEFMRRQMPGLLPPGVTPESLPDPGSRGARLFVRYCAHCHNLPRPSMHSAEEWPPVLNRMFYRMAMMPGMMDVENPSSEERQLIASYLEAHAMKTIAPDNLPSPGSRGAALFRETCSRCHKLPDPGLHTAAEWPGIVDRMGSFMRSMGRGAMTNDEKKEISEYLVNHAGK